MGSSPFCPDAPTILDGPFVPHNLIPSNGSPVDLLKSQLAPRLRHSYPLGARKGAQMCTFE